MGSHSSLDTKVIREFMENWPIEREFYERIADKATKICKLATSKAGVKAISYCRAKEGKSLEAKLHARQQERGRPYENVNEIKKNIPDLAGVRVAINYPAQRGVVGDIIKASFNVVEVKPIFDVDEEAPQKSGDSSDTQSPPLPLWGSDKGVFPGYCADHYRVHLKPEDVPMGSRWDIGRIEIQVVTTVRDVWAKAGHDTIYKKLSLATEQERLILNWLSKVTYMAECLLNQLHECREYNGPFQTDLDLGLYLTHWMEHMTTRGSKDLGDVKCLWKLLNVVDMNGPNTFQNTLKDMDFADSEKSEYNKISQKFAPLNMTVVDFVMDQIVHLHPVQEKITSSLPEAQAGGDMEAYKVRVLVDSIVGLSHLGMTSGWANLMMDTSDHGLFDSRLEKVRWLIEEEAREVVDRQIILSPQSHAVVSDLWAHFETHQRRPVKLIFNLSRLGVVKTRPTDWSELIIAVKSIKK
ncbi:hypothetical protein BDV59DRAFT_51498 [Aspergillus ambiguus]|uniref:uncharacterized protein n=1 Tax=Aspergillus ambiguus TaxID=176160 RepID=UPI003CCCEE31